MCNELEKQGLELAYEFDKPYQRPSFTDSQIRFNGVENDGHETFFVEQSFKKNHYSQFNNSNKAFEFCKTAHKGYDTAVCACLIILNHWFPDIEVSSDGSMSEWKFGIDAVKKVLGEEYVKDFAFAKG